VHFAPSVDNRLMLRSFVGGLVFFAVMGCDAPDISDNEPVDGPVTDGGPTDGGGADAAGSDAAGSDAAAIECNSTNVVFIPPVAGAELVAGETYCDELRVCVADSQTAADLIAVAPSWQCSEAPTGGPPSGCRSPEFNCTIAAPATIDSEYADVCAATLIPAGEALVCITFVAAQ